MLPHYLVTIMSKQVINDELRGSVDTYLRCGGVVNNQIKKGLMLSLRVTFFKIGEYLAKLQARWLSCVLCVPGHGNVKSRKKVHETIPLFAHNYAKYSRTLTFFHWLTQK